MVKQELLDNPVFKSAPDDAVLCYYHSSVDDGENIMFDDVQIIPNTSHYYPSLCARYLAGKSMTKKDLLDNPRFKRMKKDMSLTIFYESCTVLSLGFVAVGLLKNRFLILHEYIPNKQGEKWVKVEDKDDNLVWAELKDVAFDGEKIFK